MMLKGGNGTLLTQIDNAESSWIMRTTSLKRPFWALFLAVLVIVMLALLTGGVLDNIFTKWQNGRSARGWCGLFFVIQMSLNIAVVLLVARAYAPFLPWLQLTIAGILAAVVFFSAQQHMVDNALCLVSFD